jgi:hypothetical protein
VSSSESLQRNESAFFDIVIGCEDPAAILAAIGKSKKVEQNIDCIQGLIGWGTWSKVFDF